MRLSRKTSLLSAALVVSLSAGALAQDSTTNLPNLSSATQTTNTGTSASTTTGASSTTGTGTSKISITGGSTGTNTGNIPTITGASSELDTGLPTDLPTLTGIATVVTPIVPSTKNAPFMQTSSLPDGTVFIVVGAVLGFMAMSVLLWRGLVAWSLHRSVSRAALAQHAAMNDTKPHFRTPGPAPFYKYSDRESAISLSGLGKSGKKSGRPSTAGAAAAAPSTSSLFFSPTAGATAGMINTNPGNRGSNYLPAGYYASGAAQPGQGHQGGISLSNLGPQVQGYARAPDTPPFGAERGHMASSSSLNLVDRGHGGGQGQERTPSVYLDELFDGENAPPVPGHGTAGRF